MVSGSGTKDASGAPRPLGIGDVATGEVTKVRRRQRDVSLEAPGLSATSLEISYRACRSGMVLLVLAAVLALLTAAAVAFGSDARPGPRNALHGWP